MNNHSLQSAVTALQQGGVIAYPTEAVFGFGCDPMQPQALEKLLTLKQRNPAKGLIIIASDWAQLTPFIKPLTKEQQATLAATWPGPVTWVVPAADNIAVLLRGQHTSLAIRITAHPIARALCDTFGKAIVSTSANREGQPPCKTALDVQALFGSELDAIVAGDVGNAAKPTEIRDLLTGQIIRAG